MSKLKILKYPNPFLKKKVMDVRKYNIDKNLRSSCYRILDTMYENEGCGLAATQVGLNLRLFVIDITNNKGNPFIIINPMILDKKEIVFEEEGCLSFPGISSKIKRFNSLVVSFINEFSERRSLKISGLFARCFQHELDHLDGIVYLDRMSPLKRSLAEKKYNKKNSKKTIIF